MDSSSTFGSIMSSGWISCNAETEVDVSEVDRDGLPGSYVTGDRL